MSGIGTHNHSSVTVMAFDMNRTAALTTVDQDMNAAVHEFNVFNIILMSLALCVLTITGLFCSISCHNRRRLLKRAHMYESAVLRDVPVNPVDIRAVKRSASFRNPLSFFRKQEASKDNSRIYYIYSNPLPIGLEEEDNIQNITPGGSKEQEELTFQDYANDPNSGIILDPPNFYMQL
ncbi:uncharacterized protein si:dkey-246e1.3 isoform X1 [Oncorhynchus masou masou]|uniref:uncharacterized protein si:dkey-246e1.3 isoform X1 n=1 Tax=Oncorhynchus masou masou TaxID=90313 RepID=UPI003182DE77